jgi:hypothetical protein
MTAAEQVRDEFITECNNSMGFLVTAYGFIGPDVEMGPFEISAFFSKRDIGIECIYDTREDFAGVYIVHLENGKKPKHGFVDYDSGKRIREYLSASLLGRGVRDLKYENTPDSSKLSERQAYIRKVLIENAYLLREYAKDILDGSADIFKSMPPGEDTNRFAITSIRKMGMEAWNKKDYARVVEIYKSLDRLLTEDEKKRLEYAKNQLKF